MSSFMIECCSADHDQESDPVKADYLGIYDDGDEHCHDVPYCRACAKACRSWYKVRFVLTEER